jgi:DNA-binding NarL/FixJ family response regulator
MPTLSFHTPSGSDFPDEETRCKAATRVTGPVLPLRVFLVEDSAILRDRLAEMFAPWANVEMVGHAETEAAADAALRAQNWDVLILDLQLLHGTGLGVLASLRSHRKPGTTVIVLTNYAIPSYRARSLELGADHFFDKASDFEKIKDVFTRLGEQCRAARPNG